MNGLISKPVILLTLQFFLFSLFPISSSHAALAPGTNPPYIPGDANADGRLTQDDLLFILNYLYFQGPPPRPLLRGDANLDGRVDENDLLYLENRFIPQRTFLLGDGELTQTSSPVCGDVNRDGRVSIADIIFLVNYIFRGGPAPDPIQLGDVNSSGSINLADLLYLVNYIFRGGPAPVCPPIPTESSGFIHGEVFDAKTNLPVSGAKVTLLGRNEILLTDSEGKFSYPTPGTGTFQLTVTKSGYNYVQRIVEVVSTRDVTVGQLLLLPVDKVTSIQASTGGVATNTANTLIVAFPPGALSQDTNIELTLIERSEDLPSPLPEGVAFVNAFYGNPSLDFNVLVNVKIANRFGFPPGMKIPIGFWERVQQKWEPRGEGVVSSDGLWIEGEWAGFSSGGFFLSMPPVEERQPTGPEGANTTPLNQTEEAQDVGRRCEAEVGSCVDLRSGSLRVDHPLPPVRRLGQLQELSFIYDSDTAKPKVLIATETLIDPSGIPGTIVPQTAPFQVQVEGNLEGATFLGQEGPAAQRFLWDAKNGEGKTLPSGSYPYTIDLSHEYLTNFYTTDSFGGEPLQDTGIPNPELVSYFTTVKGRLPVVNLTGSSFGAGWTLKGLEQLSLDPDGAILYTDGEQQVVFEAGDFIAAPRSEAILLAVGDHPIGATGIGSGEIISVAFSATRPETYAATQFTIAGHFLHVIKTGENVILAQISIEKPIGEIVLSPDGTKAFVPVLIGATNRIGIQRIDLQTRISTGLLDLGRAASSAQLALTPDGTQLYIVDISNNILVVDPQALTLTKTISVSSFGISASDIQVSPNGTIAYASGFLGFPSAPVAGVFILDTQLNEIVGTIPVFLDASTPPTIVFTKDGKKAYLSTKHVFTPNLVFVMDALQHRVVKNIVLPAFTAFSDMEVSPSNNVLYGKLPVFHEFDFQGEITLLDTETDLVLGHVRNIGGADLDIRSSLLSDGRILYSGEFPGMLVYDPSVPGYRLRRFDGTISRFDTQGRLTQKEDRNGNITTYSYTPEGLLSTLTGPTGDITTFTYTNGRLSSVQDTTGRTTQFTIDSNNNLLAITDPLGNRTEFTYDNDHLLATRKDPRNFITSYFYDSFGAIQRVVDPLASQKHLDPSLSDGTINTLPPGTGTPQNPAPIVSPNSLLETFTDGRGFITQTKTDKFGAPLEITDPLGRKTVIERNSSGLPTKITQPNGAETTLHYDAFGNLVRSKSSHVGTPFAFPRTDIFYEGNFHKPVKIFEGVDPLGGVQRVTTIDYDTKGNPIRIKGGGVLFDGSFLTETEMTYDSKGLLTSVTVAPGKPEEATTAFGYDPVTGNLLTTTDPLTRITTLTYDAKGNVITSKDPKGNTTFFEYDAFNQITAVMDPLTGRTEYTYDGSGNLTSLKDALLRTTTFEYDALNRLIRTINPLNQSKTFSYDGNGNLLSTTDAKNQTTSFTYDSANQLTQKTLPGDTVSYAYDLLGNLTLIQDSDSKLSFTYDGFSRLIQAQTGDPLNPFILQPQTTLSYTYNLYNLRGDRFSITDPSSRILRYIYDKLSRLTGLDNPSLGPIASFQYDPLSRRISLGRFPGNLFTFFTYDASSQLLTLIHRQGPFGPYLEAFSYTYDLNGNRLTKTQDLTTSTYTYDPLNRLTSASNPLESFTYDPVGNRNPATQVYDSTNRLLDDGTFTYTYDPNGNLTTKTEKANPLNTTTYTYDSENQLTRIDFPGGTFAEYKYDGLGRRIQKNVNGTLTRYVYDNEDILMEYDGTNTPRARFTHGPGIDEPLTMERDLDVNGSFETQVFYLQDGLGSVTALTDSTSTILERYEYDSFGNLTIKDGAGNILPQSAFGNPYTYTGREFDPESGLYFMRGRYLDPKTGRFIQEDPFGPQWDINVYSYAYQNPVNFTDPTGIGPRGAAIGAAIGSAIGGVVGGVVGGVGGSLALPGGGTVAVGTSGALEGAVVGATVGAVIGHTIEEGINLFKDPTSSPDAKKPPGHWVPDPSGKPDTWRDPTTGDTWHWHPDPTGTHGGDHWDVGRKDGTQEWWPKGGERGPKPRGAKRPKSSRSGQCPAK